MTKQNTIARPWTADEDAILGTNTLAKIAGVINRPTSQIQKRMKQLGVAHFGVRGTPRSPARVADEQAVAERNKARFARRMRDGMGVAAMVADGRTVTAAAQDLGIGVEAARQQLLQFLRAAGHRARLGEALLSSAAWREIAPGLLGEAIRRMSIELETGSRDVWQEPVLVKDAPGEVPIRA